MDCKVIIYALYEGFSRGISEEFEWSPTESSDKAVDRFIHRWSKRGVHYTSLGVSFLYDYFCTAYNYWTDNGVDLKIIPFSWIIGEPQLRRWDNRSEHYQYFYSEGILTHSNVPKLSELKRELFNDTSSESTREYEELEKQRFYNTAEGFINCILLTTLCSDDSKWCRGCINRDECISELKDRDPRTALDRGYLKL